MNRELVFLVEGKAEKSLLEALAPRLLPLGCAYKIVCFRGKQDMEKTLPRTLKAWQNPKARFLILRDQDCGVCEQIKARLLELVRAAACVRPFKVRIACRALENWYLAQLEVVGRVFSKSRLSQMQNRARFRRPDDISNPVAELEKLTAGLYQKVSGSSRLGATLALDNDRSPSFKNFIGAIKFLTGLPE